MKRRLFQLLKGFLGEIIHPLRLLVQGFVSRRRLLDRVVALVIVNPLGLVAPLMKHRQLLIVAHGTIFNAQAVHLHRVLLVLDGARQDPTA